MPCPMNRSSCSGNWDSVSARCPSEGGVEHWRVESTRAISLALAPTTRRGYAASCELFLFCRGNGLGCPSLVEVEHVQMLAMHLHDRGLAPGSIQGKLSALTFYLKLSSGRDITCHHSLLHSEDDQGLGQRTGQTAC